MGSEMKWGVVLFVVVIMSLSLVKAVDTSDDLARQAEGAYSTGNFKVAVDLYQQLLDHL